MVYMCTFVSVCVFLKYSPPYFMKQAPSLELHVQLDRVANKLQEYRCVCVHMSLCMDICAEARDQ